MKRYKNTLLGMVEDSFGRYCFCDETKDAAGYNITERHIRELDSKDHLIDSLNDSLKDLISKLEDKNVLLNSVIELLTKNLDRYEKDDLTKRLYDIKPNSNSTTISMGHNIATEVTQKCQSI